MTALVTVLPPSRAPGAVPTGPVGRHLARRLLSEGVRVRVLAPAAEHAGWPVGAELIDGTVTQPAASPSAFRDLDWLCLAGLVAMVPEQLRDLANLALAGGLKRAVVLASHGSDFEDEYSPETWQWLAFEQALCKQNAEWTYLRPTGLFASMLTGGYPITSSSWASQIRRGQSLREFMPEVAYPFIDEDDVAAVIAAILLQGGHNESVLDITGTLSSAADRADAISAAIDVTLYAMNAFAANADTIASVIGQQINLARSLLGRHPNSLADWLAGNVTPFVQIPAPTPSATEVDRNHSSR